MHEAESRYTIVIVTHNMQQAARVSEETGFYSRGDDRVRGRPRRCSPTLRINGRKTISLGASDKEGT